MEPWFAERFVRHGEKPDAFSAKRLYPNLTVSEALARIARLASRAANSQASAE